MAVAEKHRGLFKVRTFAADLDVRGDFVLDGKVTVERTRADSRIVWGLPVIGLGLGDPRGLVGAPVFEWAGQRLFFERGSGLPGLESGLHAAAPALDPTRPQRLPYSLAIRLQGTESLAILPLADDNRVHLASDWPHPGFGGQFLPQPESQQIGKAGFVAQWTITALASNAQQQAQAMFDGRKGELRSIERLEVGFIDPIDIYSLSDRALKYGFLFIGLTFGRFMLLEVLKSLADPPGAVWIGGSRPGDVLPAFDRVVGAHRVLDGVPHCRRGLYRAARLLP